MPLTENMAFNPITMKFVTAQTKAAPGNGRYFVRAGHETCVAWPSEAGVSLHQASVC